MVKQTNRGVLMFYGTADNAMFVTWGQSCQTAKYAQMLKPQYFASVDATHITHTAYITPSFASFR